MDYVPEREEEDEDELSGYASATGTLMDSRTSYLNDLLKEKLEQAFHKQTSQVVLHDLAKIAIETDPIDLAHAIISLPLSVRSIVYENLPDTNAKTLFMINTTNSTRLAIFHSLSDIEIRELIETMPTDEAVSLVDDLSDRRLKRVLDLLEHQKASRIRELLKHDRHTAGRLMTNEFFAFPMTARIGQVAKFIRDNPGIEMTRSVFVTNESGELMGFVPARTLIVNPHHVPLKQVVRPILHSISPEANRDEVVDLAERYKLPALPVVSDDNHLLGVITYEDVVELMNDIADETVASFAGTAEDVSDSEEPMIKRFFWRAPWLFVTLLCGLVSATGLAYFHDQPWFALVGVFVPLITGMSGNVGLQCSTILVRGIATGEISLGSKREAMRREMSIGLLIGLVFGLICGLVVYLLNVLGVQSLEISPLAVGSIVSCGLFGACLTATMLGTFSPVACVRMRIDPAVASGPIVAACNDVLSTYMFIVVAKFTSMLFV